MSTHGKKFDRPGVGDPAIVIRGRRGILVVLLVYCLAGDAVAVVALVFSLKSNLGEDLFLLVVCSLGILLFVPFVIKPPVLLRFGPLGLQEFRGWFRRPRDLVPWSSVRAIRLFPYRPLRVGIRDRRLGIVPAIPYDPIWDSRRRSTRAFGLPITIGERDVRNRRLDITADEMRSFKPSMTIEHAEPPTGRFRRSFKGR